MTEKDKHEFGKGRHAYTLKPENCPACYKPAEQDITICDKCGCMTKTIKGYCGKCKKFKPAEQKREILEEHEANYDFCKGIKEYTKPATTEGKDTLRSIGAASSSESHHKVSPCSDSPAEATATQFTEEEKILACKVNGFTCPRTGNAKSCNNCFECQENTINLIHNFVKKEVEAAIVADRLGKVRLVAFEAEKRQAVENAMGGLVEGLAMIDYEVHFADFQKKWKDAPEFQKERYRMAARERIKFARYPNAKRPNAKKKVEK